MQPQAGSGTGSWWFPYVLSVTTQLEPDLLSQAEVAHRLGVSRTTVWRLVRRGELELVHIGARALVPRRCLQKFIGEKP